MSEKSFDVAIIGAGPGGYVAALRCAQLQLRTVCIEKDPYPGGTCLHVGCIPSKTLLHASEDYWKLLCRGREEGILFDHLAYDWQKMQSRKEEVIGGLHRGIRALFQRAGVEYFSGIGRLLGGNEIEVVGKDSTHIIKAQSIILASGSVPTPLPFLPFDELRVLSSTGALRLSQVPEKMVVVGAGIIGVELGSVYSRLGTHVEYIEFLDRICPVLDKDVSRQLQKILMSQGLSFSLSSQVVAGQVEQETVQLTVEAREGGVRRQIEADVALLCIGRKPYTEGLGLEKGGVICSPNGFVKIDQCFRTSAPHIYAIGDLVDGPMLAHKAAEEGVAVAEWIAGHHPAIDYACIPTVVYTFPEVASVGLTEEEAQGYGIRCHIGTCSLKANSRARCAGESAGFVKILAEARSDRVIGVHIIAPHASELIGECALAIKTETTASELATLCHPHPTLSEAIKEAALATQGRALHQ